MPFHHLDVRRDGSIARVTLARPEARNAFNAPLIAELADWAAAAAADERVRADFAACADFRLLFDHSAGAHRHSLTEPR